jgi:hypothetical protein
LISTYFTNSMEQDTDDPELANNWLVKHTLTAEECASDAFGIFLIFFSCLYTESQNAIEDVGGPPLGQPVNGRYVRPVCVHLDGVKEALHRYHSQFDTVSSMKADIIDSVFMPRVWAKLVADHASGWEGKSAPHIPSWGPIQLHTFISSSEKLRVMLGMPPTPVGPAPELVSSSAAVDVDDDVHDMCAGLLASPEEELEKQLACEHAALSEAITTRVTELVANSYELEGDCLEGGGEDEGGEAHESDSNTDSEGGVAALAARAMGAAGTATRPVGEVLRLALENPLPECGSLIKQRSCYNRTASPVPIALFSVQITFCRG